MIKQHIKLIDLFQRESNEFGWRFFIFIMVSGISNAGILAIVNTAADVVSEGTISIRYFLLFIVTISLYIYAMKNLLYNANRIAEEVVNRVRIRLADKVRRCDLQFIENAGHGNLFSRITKETAIISQSGMAIVGAGPAVIMVVFSMFYIATISGAAFLLAVMMIVVAAIVFLRNHKHIMGNYQQSIQKEVELFDVLNGILKGFKEIKMNNEKNKAIFEDFKQNSNTALKYNIKAKIQYANNYIFTQVFFYFLIGIIVFILPAFSPDYVDDIVKIIAAILFLIGPLSNVVMTLSNTAQTNISIMNIYTLEEQLTNAVKTSTTNEEDNLPINTNFDEIKLHNLMFHYLNQDGSPAFEVGPMDFHVKKGELVFIIGGNGSGKTTFMKMFSGLYSPLSGWISVDDEKIEKCKLVAYRELFSVIYSDFHLFNKLYGLHQINPEKVQELLKVMEIEDKTKFENGVFSHINLSTGQRKRLALLTTFLEDKPIYIFDEWAADQDPHFRKYFYEVLLKELQAQGKTIIAVTHDDHYFHVADRVVKMEYGQFEKYETMSEA